MLSKETLKLEIAYDIFNSYYFKKSLPQVVITIQSSRGAYGHCTKYKAWASGDERCYELNLGAEYLNRPIENVLATLMHEMVHIYCMENGLKDTSNMGRYHNKIFKEEAEKRGLVISKAEHIGWSKTQPSEKFIRNIQAWGLAEECENYRFGGIDDHDSDDSGRDGEENGTVTPVLTKPKKPSSTRKYICPVCGNSVRATKDVNILCMDCNVQMVKE